MTRQMAMQQISQISLTGKSSAWCREEGAGRLELLLRVFMPAADARQVPNGLSEGNLYIYHSFSVFESASEGLLFP
jgi:hypothetical protein